MPVTISTRRARRAPVKAIEMRRRAERMLVALRMADAELSLMLCDDSTIQELNRDYRGRDRATDVLAFAMQEGEGQGVQPQLLGDVVISWETARRQAHDRGRTVVSEVTHLLAHGLLHLLGFDHQTDAEERRMNARADALCAAATPGRRSPRN